MSDLIYKMTQQMESVSNWLSKDGKKFIKSILSKGEKISNKGKVQIEIKKLKWELKQQYNELGKYVAEKKISKSVTDFSHDAQFLKLVNKVNKIRLYISEQKKARDSKEYSYQSGRIYQNQR